MSHIRGSSLKTIKVSDEAHSLLVKIGGYSETMDDIIKRLANEHLNKKKK